MLESKGTYSSGTPGGLPCFFPCLWVFQSLVQDLGKLDVCLYYLKWKSVNGAFDQCVKKKKSLWLVCRVDCKRTIMEALKKGTLGFRMKNDAYTTKVALKGERNRWIYDILYRSSPKDFAEDWEKNQIWLRFLVLPFAEAGKIWGGAILGRKPQVLFDIVRLSCLWEILLFLYFLDGFDRHILNLHETCLHSSDSCSCLSPHTPLHFRNLFFISNSHCS